MRRPEDVKMVTIKLLIAAAICGAIVTVWYFEEGPGKHYWGGFSKAGSSGSDIECGVKVMRGNSGAASSGSGTPAATDKPRPSRPRPPQPPQPFPSGMRRG